MSLLNFYFGFSPFRIPCDVDVLIAPNEHHRLHNGLREMLVFVCDYAHDRCLKLLIARGKVRRSKLGEFFG